MLDVFDLRARVIDEYAAFSRSFTRIAAADIAAHVEAEYARERYWPEPLKQNELLEFGEYRTQRLVLEAWDRLHAAETHPSASGAIA